jgi:hypothetical protein
MRPALEQREQRDIGGKRESRIRIVATDSPADIGQMLAL